MLDAGSGSGTPIRGHVLAFFAFDLGFQVDLAVAESLVHGATSRSGVRMRRHAPAWFDFSPPPLRFGIEGQPVAVGDATTEPEAEVVLYDFGAALLTYKLPLPPDLSSVRRFAGELHEHPGLLADARARVGRVLDDLRASVERPGLSEAFEDYAVFVVTSWGDGPAEDMVARHGRVLASIIEADDADLAEAQVERITGGAMGYSRNDAAVIDWNSAVLFDAEPDDVVAVLQHANVELLQLRVLDQELDAILDQADETLAGVTASRFWPAFASSPMLRRFAAVQTDAVVLFEGVNNAIKLLGNQYLARLYRMTAARLDLPAWQESVQRKIGVAESLYQKMSDSTSTKRLEVLEWVIIILIAVSIALPFTPWYH